MAKYTVKNYNQQAMQHAEFVEGNVLFDTLNCRDVKVLETYFSSDDLNQGEVFVEPLRNGPPYTLHKKHLYSRDEMSTALTHQDIDERLNEIRKDRLLDDAPLLQYIDFHPDDITETDIETMQTLEVELDRIWKQVREDLSEDIFHLSEPDLTPDEVAESVICIIRRKLNVYDGYAHEKS